MAEIFVLVEHRQGKVRDITFEMLHAGTTLASQQGASSTAVLLGHNVKNFAEELATKSSKVLVVEDAQLEHFNSILYQKVLSALITKYQPLLTLIGHSAFGMDLAPSLSVEMGFPLVTDCIGLSFDGSRLRAVRSVYGGKVNANVSLRESEGYVATVRPGVFSPAAPGEKKGGIVMEPSPLQGTIDVKKFIEYIEAPITGEDITQAEIIVSVGQGIGGPENIPMIEEVAKSLGGVIACSRPVVDRNWLPKERQVGISGKTVKPKVYIAIGISGAFQHVTAMQGSETIIAINKDPRAPIFGVADYGIVDDFQNIIPILKEKAKGMK
ncbi:MAG TPA: electron transfer flavoprotein subunit alpha/FixB family protein [Thermodesulfobacteriota bacterium]|jgi:electron transfer flavoprotein alpha subunit|nr:electron transfer flavoprotein subunit alpha/FixB family protein [Thermodesulfobacteriota bacterium]